MRIMEVWKTFDECKTYEVSSMGRVRRADNNQMLNGSVNNKGYIRYDLRKDGKRLVRSGHRMVAITFIPNPNNFEMINHINGNKTDNRIENLEWCTCKENVVHTFNVLGRIIENRKSVLCIETGVIYSSCTSAAGGDYRKSGKIVRCCKGKQKTAYGYHWQYAELAQ